MRSPDFAHERLIGTAAGMSLNPGKFRLPLAQNRHIRPVENSSFEWMESGGRSLMGAKSSLV